MIFNSSSTYYAFYLTWHKIYCYMLKNVSICIIIYHHGYNHYDIVDVIWFTVIDESGQDIPYVHGESQSDDVGIKIAAIHYDIWVIFVCHFVFQIFFVVLYYKTFNCVISFVHISCYWFISDICSAWSYLLI